MNLARINFERTVKYFLGRLESSLGLPVSFLETPTEEQDEILKRGHGTIHSIGADGKGQKKGVSMRDEETYLYSTRRFPVATGNVLPAPSHIPAGQSLFFNVAVGGDGAQAGFPTGFLYSPQETNITTPNQIPKGMAYKLKQLGLSCNAEAQNADIQQIMDAGHLLFTRSGVEYTLRLGPALFWPGGVGVVTATQVQGQQSSHNGIADWKAMRYLKVPREIRALDTFNFVYASERATRSIDATNWTLSQFTLLRVGLWGLQVNTIPQ